MPQFSIYAMSFAFVALASQQIGKFATRLNLPLITGYLATGIIAGPFVLGLLSDEAMDNLHAIEELSLAFIAFAAGSELYLKELRGRLRSIAWVTLGLILATYILISTAVFLISGFIPFLEDVSTVGRLGAAIMAGAILVARSPSSAIAVINELRARGPYTKTILGVTVIMDVIVIVVFAINSSLADALLITGRLDPSFILLLATELALALSTGYALGKILGMILSWHIDFRAKVGLILLSGYIVFVLSDLLRTYTHENMPVEVFVEPLLIAVTGSFVVTNFSRYRREFLDIVHTVGPAIYVIFFTLTGASLALDTFAAIWPIALALFVVRLVAVVIGSFTGGMLAGDPMRYNRLLWMGFITQAGVALGLAREAAVEFPTLGGGFATMVISTIVLNETVGPILLKFGIRKTGESHLPGAAEPDEVRDALILGVEPQTVELARLLQQHNWQVVMADIDPTHVEQVVAEDVDERLISEINRETLSGLITKGTDALVALLDDDAANYKACEIAYEEFGIKRLIVRPNDLSWAGKFNDLGAEIVDPASAMIYFLDHSVRAPQSTALFSYRDPQYDIVQMTMTDTDSDGLPLRDLRLPDSVLILGIQRDGRSIVPHGYTKLHLKDEVTLVGKPKELDAVVRRLGY